MLISVIIPTYNRAHLISRAIQSVINQTYPSWELIIVDDGSTDGTDKVVQPYSIDSRIRYHKKKNSGAAHSRNIGVDISKGEWITFLDSDDEGLPTWLEKYVYLIISENAQVCCCGMVQINSQGVTADRILPQKMGAILNSKVGRFTGGTFIMRREIFLTIGGYDDQIKSGQHTELALRLMPYLASHGIEIHNIFEPLIHVHIHLGERIRGNFDSKIQGVQYMLKKHKHLFDKHPLTKSTYLTNLAYYYKKKKQYQKALRYYIKAFVTFPSPKKFLRIILFFK